MYNPSPEEIALAAKRIREMRLNKKLLETQQHYRKASNIKVAGVMRSSKPLSENS